MISIDELPALGITLDNQLGLLAILDDGSEIYSVLNIDKSKMIGILTRHFDCTFDITTKDGRVFKFLQSSDKATSVMRTTVIPPSTPASTSTSIVKASQQCIWCDNFDHYYSACPEFHQVIRYDHIYLSKTRRILRTRTGKELLALAIENDEMKAYL